MIVIVCLLVSDVINPKLTLRFLRTRYTLLATHYNILKIYGIIQYSTNIFKCNLVKIIFEIYKKITFLLKKIISVLWIKSSQFDFIHYIEIIIFWVKHNEAPWRKSRNKHEL